jgi:hypothetical protein
VIDSLLSALSVAIDIQELSIEVDSVGLNPPLDLTPLCAFAHSLRHLIWTADDDTTPSASTEGQPAAAVEFVPVVLRQLLECTDAGVTFPRLAMFDMRIWMTHPDPTPLLSERTCIDLVHVLPALRAMHLNGLMLPITLPGIFQQLTHLSLTFAETTVITAAQLGSDAEATIHQVESLSRVIHSVSTHLTRLTSLHLSFNWPWCATGVMARRVVDALTPLVHSSTEFRRLEIEVPVTLIVWWPERQSERVWREKFRDRWMPTLLRVHLIWRHLQPSHHIPIARSRTSEDGITQLLTPFLSDHDRREYTRRLAHEAHLATAAAASSSESPPAQRLRARRERQAAARSQRCRCTCGLRMPTWMQCIGGWLTSLCAKKANHAPAAVVDGEINLFASESGRMSTRVADILQAAGRTRIESRVFTFALCESRPQDD